MSLNTLPATSTTARNPFLAYAEAMTRRTIDGKTFKFVKGDFLVGKDGDTLAIGTELVPIMASLMVGWIKWGCGKPVDGHMGLVADGFQPPRRRDLDDYESDTWEMSSDGLRDPWQLTNTIVFIDPATKAIYTFNTSSRGGFDAIALLCKTFAKKAPAGTYPVIRLDVGSYQHQDRSIGRVKFPVFDPVKFVPAQDFDAVLTASRGETEALTAPTEAPAAIEYDAGERPFAPIDDDIPF